MSHNVLLLTVNALFATSDWTSLNINTVPTGFVGKIPNDKSTVRVNVFEFNNALYYNGDSITGKIVCDIFVPVELGMNQATQIADNLDTILKKKTISGNLQTTNSLTKIVGIDSNDSQLLRVNYEVDFNFNN